MDQKTTITQQLDELARAAGLTLPTVDATSMGPLGLTKTLLKGLPRQALADAMPSFVGTWLDMVACEVQGVAVEGQVILAALLPPANILQLQGGTPEQQAILASGATVSIRPPHNDLLVLSPVSADAAVYQISSAGLERIAPNMAGLVQQEVGRALGRA